MNKIHSDAEFQGQPNTGRSRVAKGALALTFGLGIGMGAFAAHQTAQKLSKPEKNELLPEDVATTSSSVAFDTIPPAPESVSTEIPQITISPSAETITTSTSQGRRAVTTTKPRPQITTTSVTLNSPQAPPPVTHEPQQPRSTEPPSTTSTSSSIPS